ncbi:MAG TPA: hypothetical protein VIL85_05745 [Thermomicrobiales bacterium]
MAEGVSAATEAQIGAELAALLGESPAAWSAELLTHNLQNAVTVGIWRVRAGERSFILKVVSPGRGGAATGWAASDEPTHWNYWAREALAYRHGVTTSYAAAGIAGPTLLARYARPDGAIALWLADALAEGALPGPRWSLAEYARFAQRLGMAQGRIASDAAPAYPWLSRQFLRRYSLSKAYDPALLDDDRAWAQPLVREHFPAALRPALVRFHHERERFFAILERLPRTLCHLDVWPNNLFARADGRFVLVDWAFVGDGALGEDAGNLVPDAVFDLFVPAHDLPELDRVVFAGYLAGLREAGWDGDERLVRLGMCASAIKYVWLPPLMLARAGDATQLDYGGKAAVNAARRYSERGCVFTFLMGWAEEARELAAAPGY